MNPAEVTNTRNGLFTIRRSDKLWAGTWSDMTIEQMLDAYNETSGRPGVEVLVRSPCNVLNTYRISIVFVFKCRYFGNQATRG